MKIKTLVCAAVAAAMIPAAALADDPRDPEMRSAAARARDRAMIRQLNLEEGARVRLRDARNVQVMRAGREDGAQYAARSRDYDRARTDYARSRAQYEQDMAEWRRAVAACRAGYYAACDD